MPNTLAERAEEVVAAARAFYQAQSDLHEAEAKLDFAKRLLMLARDRYAHEWEVETAYHDYPDHNDLDRRLAQDFVWEMKHIALLGKTIRQACRIAMVSLKKASTEAIVSYLEEHGFEFSSEAPAREVHAALVKQPWVRRDQEIGEWEYVQRSD